MLTDDIKQAISELLKQLFSVLRQQKELKNELDEQTDNLKAQFYARNQQLEKQLIDIKAKLYELVSKNRSVLLTGPRKSFAMLYGIVLFEQKRLNFKVTDKSAVEELCRKHRILTTVGSFERTWKPDASALKAWLTQHPDIAPQFEPFTEQTGGFDEIYAKPNDTFFTEFDSSRLSNERTKLEPPKQDD